MGDITFWNPNCFKSYGALEDQKLYRWKLHQHLKFQEADMAFRSGQHKLESPRGKKFETEKVRITFHLCLHLIVLLLIITAAGMWVAYDSVWN